jgi:hypothetical protein
MLSPFRKGRDGEGMLFGKCYAGRVVLFETFGSQRGRIGLPFVPYGRCTDQSRLGWDQVEAEYNLEGRLVVLRNFCGGRISWVQKTSYRNGELERIVLEDGDGETKQIISCQAGRRSAGSKGFDSEEDYASPETTSAE